MVNGFKITGDVEFRPSKDDPAKFLLINPLSFTWNGVAYEISNPGPDGTHMPFETDLASVPQWLTWLIPRYGAYTTAAIVHDYLCVVSERKAFSRREADLVFRTLLDAEGVRFARRWIMWAAVRAAGLAKFRKVKGAGSPFSEVIQLILVAVPAAAFLAIPGIVVCLFMALAWVISAIADGALSLFVRDRAVADETVRRSLREYRN